MSPPDIDDFENAATFAAVPADAATLGPWNPGIESTLPPEFLPLSTMHRAESVTTTLEEAHHRRELTGLPLHKLTAFRPERLALHEILIRVMAELSVPDGDRYTDLGENFRAITARIFDRHIAPRLPDCARLHTQVIATAHAIITSAVDHATDTPSAPTANEPETSSLWARLTRRTTTQGTTAAAVAPYPGKALPGEAALAAIAGWRDELASATDPLTAQSLQSLITIATAILNRSGRLGPDFAPLITVAAQMVGNSYGSELIGSHLDPFFREAARKEGYRSLPVQSAPIVMNVKGASAAGKSTLRPQQRLLAERLGVDWSDFALISPDIWRKYLLDYTSLGSAARYAGTLTGHELETIDRKLDGYMARKAETGRMTHLVIDRFRFDSFAPDHEVESGKRFLTRFGSSIYLFFMITPPAATVERAYKRGLAVGRFKAVDDLLAHNVEAYTGIPGLFFTWALRHDKHVHFEFLDNSVALGERPRTVAFGINNHLIVLDVSRLIDIDRYRHLNVNARSPGEVFLNHAGSEIAYEPAFLRDCVRRVPVVEFAGQATGDVYLRLENGCCVFWDQAMSEAENTEALARDTVAAIATAATVSLTPPPASKRQRTLSPAEADTLGHWGDAYPAQEHWNW